MLPIFLAFLGCEADQRRFEQIYLDYRKQMFAVARTYLKNDADAEDAVHDVFLRIASKCWESVNRIDNEADLRSYLLKAVKNKALNMLERRSQKDLSLEEALPEQEPEGDKTDETFAAVCAGIEEGRLLAAINSLPELYRDALYYRFVLDFSLRETAQTTGKSLAATKKQLQRGKQKLLSLLQE